VRVDETTRGRDELRDVRETPNRTDDPQSRDNARFFNVRGAAVVAGLVVLDYVIVSLLSAAAAQQRVAIPYRPTFVNHAQASPPTPFATEMPATSRAGR
jgi:hypothetical protein